MVFGLIVIIFLIVFVAFFIGKNIGHECTLWIFKTFENLPVSTLVLSAFAAGIVFTLICLLLIKINRPISRKKDIKSL